MSRVVWWEIESPDPERFQEFHAALFGWEFQRAFENTDLDADYWQIRSDGQDIGGLQRARQGTTPEAGVRVYVHVEDLEETLRRAVELGCSVERERVALGGEDRWFAIFRDPTGISFGLWTPNPPTDRDAAEVAATRVIRAPKADVWRMLTTDRSQWWPDMVFEAKAGAALRETWTEEGRILYASGTVVAVAEPNHLEFEWSEPGWRASLSVRFALTEVHDGTIVTVAERGFDNLAGQQGLQAEHVQGWEYHLDRLRDACEVRRR